MSGVDWNDLGDIPSDPNRPDAFFAQHGGPRERYASQAPPRDPRDLGALTIAEVLDRPPRDHLVKGVLGRGETAVLVSEPGVSKTFLALHLGLSIAQGREVFGARVRPGFVVYVAGEGVGGFGQRLQAYAQHHGLDRAAPFLLVPQAIDLTEKAEADKLAELVMRKADILKAEPVQVTLDTLARCSGGADENSPEGMGGFIAGLDRVRARTGAAALAIHHLGKDRSRGARGHSSLIGAADTIIELTKEEETGDRLATIAKQKDGIDGLWLRYRLKRVELGRDADGDLLSSCAIEQVEGAEPVTRKKRLTARERQALTDLHNCTIEKGQPAPKDPHYPTGVQIVAVDDWRTWMLDSGTLDRAAANPRADFRRVFDGLKAAGAIGCWGDHVWAVGRG